MMLFFARHGNTFEANETPRIIGARSNPALTEKGREQAHVLGIALRDAGIVVDAVRAGPLQRTLQFARIAMDAAGIHGQVAIDQRLRELDFGTWEGLDDGELIRRHGRAAIEAWRRDGARPDGCGWTPSEAEVRDNLLAMANELIRTTLCITSNGVLRYAMELDPEAFVGRGGDGGFRVGTGRICALRREGAAWKLLLWNETPTAGILRQIASP
jgi:probable phosphoglycerate mutase